MSKRTKICLEFARKSDENKQGKLTSRMLAEELISRCEYEPEEFAKATSCANAFLKRYCTEQKKGLLEPRIPKHYKLDIEHLF